MAALATEIARSIVTVGLGLYLAAVAILCVAPLLEAIIEARRPVMPDLPAAIEYFGVALAIAGLANSITAAAAIGVTIALLGAFWSAGKVSNSLHPAMQLPMFVGGVLSLGVVAEYRYFVS